MFLHSNFWYNFISIVPSPMQSCSLNIKLQNRFKVFVKISKFSTSTNFWNMMLVSRTGKIVTSSVLSCSDIKLLFLLTSFVLVVSSKNDVVFSSFASFRIPLIVFYFFNTYQYLPISSNLFVIFYNLFLEVIGIGKLVFESALRAKRLLLPTDDILAIS